MGRRAAAGVAAARHAWRRSLQLRVVTFTLVTAGALVGAFAYLVVELTTNSSLDRAVQAAAQQVRDDASRAQEQLSAHQQPGDRRLEDTMRWVVDRLSQPAGPRTGSERLVLLEPPIGAAARPVATGGLPVERAVSGQLAVEVANGQVARQIVTVQLQDQRTTYLVYGVPIPPGWGYGPPFRLYVLTPLTAEIEAAADVRNTVLVTGAALVVLLAALTGLVTRMVVRPVRLAARTAQRLSAGLLDQRMLVKGEDDLALLAESFNQMATNLQRQIVRLEEMSRQQRRFTSDVSHELRTPLTTVRMAADLLFNERKSYSPEVARSAELLQHELDRFEDLLTELLEISRFDAGFATLDSEPVDLAEIVRRAVTRLSALCARNGTALQMRLPERPVIAEVDPRRVERILRNLIGNAAEYGEGRPLVVTLACDDQAAAITVRDYGVGLRPGEERLVFNRFWRADPSRTRRTGGTGLGLSISMEDAKLHGGWLDAWGRPGRGSQFRLTLPLRSGEQVTSSPLPLTPDDADAPLPAASTPDGSVAAGPDGGQAPAAAPDGSVAPAAAPGGPSGTPGATVAPRQGAAEVPRADPELTGRGAAP
ncbi:MAG TPA: MtrAB system histidine kinase MtrB [Natronosporangium sp.]|nr:MtrAB system histidine kinase MtrB [Natronosporangium sp.]